MSTEDGIVSGNMGLKDQVLALKWIKQNIKYFEGNSDSITIEGLGSGAASVHFHYLSPKSKNLFNRGVSVSGSSLNHFALAENVPQNTKTLAASLGCPTKTSKILIKCLKTIPVYDIITATVESLYAYAPFNLIPFGPVVEKNSTDAFLAEHPYKLLREGKVYDVPWLASYLSHDGYFVSLCRFFFQKYFH